MRSDLGDFQQEIIDRRTKKKETILNETLRSNQEVEIANFLYINGIDYVYEPIYEYEIQFSEQGKKIHKLTAVFTGAVPSLR